MAKTQLIKLPKTTDKWVKLMLHFQNSVHDVFRIKCTDGEAASGMRLRLGRVLYSHPTWFNMVLAQRQCDVYVVKINNTHDVVIQDDLSEVQE